MCDNRFLIYINTAILYLIPLQIFLFLFLSCTFFSPCPTTLQVQVLLLQLVSRQLKKLMDGIEIGFKGFLQGNRVGLGLEGEDIDIIYNQRVKGDIFLKLT